MSISKLNNVAKKYGIELVKGDGYFYWMPLPNASPKVVKALYDAETTSVYVYRFNHMSYQEWLSELERFVKSNLMEAASTVSKFKPSTEASKIKKAATKMGYEVSVHSASTGTIYLTISDGSDDLIVRISDHMECYPPKRGERKLCVSPDEGSTKWAISQIQRGIQNIKQYIPDPAKEREHNHSLSLSIHAAKIAKKNAANSAEKIRASLDPQDIAIADKPSMGKREYAMKLAKKYNITRGKMYHALYGKPWK